jgi:hypothetical protein
MRNITFAGLAVLLALAAACGGSGGKQLQYGTPQAPTLEEQAAATDAHTSLAGTLTFAPPTGPTLGAPGLADQLVASLGGYAAPTAVAASPSPQVRRTVGRSVALAVGTSDLDPACVASTATSVTWNACGITISETDPVSGDTTDGTVRISGHLTSTPGTGTTTWDIDQAMTMNVTSSGDTIRMNATVGLGGSIKVAASTIVGHTTSSVDVTASYMGISATEAVTTSLDLDLGYVADPFCVTDGTLTLQQIWRRRPSGATAAELADQGWRFEWTGCGQFTVSHGT